MQGRRGFLALVFYKAEICVNPAQVRLGRPLPLPRSQEGWGGGYLCMELEGKKNTAGISSSQRNCFELSKQHGIN